MGRIAWLGTCSTMQHTYGAFWDAWLSHRKPSSRRDTGNGAQDPQATAFSLEYSIFTLHRRASASYGLWFKCIHSPKPKLRIIYVRFGLRVCVPVRVCILLFIIVYSIKYTRTMFQLAIGWRIDVGLEDGGGVFDTAVPSLIGIINMYRIEKNTVR